MFRWFEAHSNAASKIGFLCCIVVYAVIVVYALSQSGQWGGVRQDVSAVASTLAVKAGFGIGKVTVEGRVNLPDADFDAAMGPRSGVSIFAFDTDAARARLKSLGWVREARVMRLLPSTLVVELEENRPFAVWRNGEQFTVVDAEGAVLAQIQPGGFPDLPVVSGAEAARPAREQVAAVGAYPELMRHVREFERISARRWDLVFNTGMRVKLPVENQQQALGDLNLIATKNAALLNDIVEMDFRVSSQFTVRLKDNSKRARKKFVSWLSKAREGHDSN